jgi:predicted nucleic acid-binding protein
LAVEETVLASFLERQRRIGLDTNVLIYAVEENPMYVGLVRPILKWVESSKGRAVTSTITMLELLVQPYRLADIDRVNKFYALLTTYPHLEWIEPSLQIADRAAWLRAEHNLRTPDAIQAATALEREATGFVSNDPLFKRVEGIEVLVLDELVGDEDTEAETEEPED